jgi:hypothetical protein
MESSTDSVSIVVELPSEDYARLAAHARDERATVSQIIPSLLSSALRRQKKAKDLFAQASRSYRTRLAKEGKLGQTLDEMMGDLREIREEVAEELFPG